MMTDYQMTAFQRALAEKLANVRDDAVALGASVLGQCKGDRTAARQIVGEAHAWLCEIDPRFQRPLLAAGLLLGVDVESVDDLRVKLAAADQRLVDLQAACDSLIADETARADAAEVQAAEWEAKLREASGKLGEAARLVGLVDKLQADLAAARAASADFSALSDGLRAELDAANGRASAYATQLDAAAFDRDLARRRLAEVEAELATLRAGAVPLVAVAPAAAPAPVAARPSMPSPASVPAAAVPAARPVAAAPAAKSGDAEPVRPASISEAQWAVMSPGFRRIAAARKG